MKNKLMTHLVCGYPSLDDSKILLETLSKYSEYIEIQFPFSDPIADGPIISTANEIALKNGIKVEDCFNFIEKNIKNVKPGLLIMTYYNIIHNYGVKKFIKKASSIGIYGLIIPDIPFDEIEGEELISLCKTENINLIQVVSPSCNPERLEKIFELSSGFIYAVSQNMTTGNKATFDEEFKGYINSLKKYSNISIGVGFGIKTKDDVDKVCMVADFAVIGSEIIKIFKEKGIKGLDEYLKSLF